MQIIINEKTPTINHLYGQRGTFKFLKKEAKELRERIIDETVRQSQEQDFETLKWQDKILQVETIVFEDWFTRQNTIKKKDVANREKFLIDSVFKGLNIDDSQIWKNTLIKKTEENKTMFRTVMNIKLYSPKDVKTYNGR